MEEMQIEAGTVTEIPPSEVDRFIAAVEAKPDATYPGKVVASMLRLVMSALASPPPILVQRKKDGRIGRKRTAEQRQRISDGMRKRAAKRGDQVSKGRDDVGDVTTFQGDRDTRAAGDGVATVA